MKTKKRHEAEQLVSPIIEPAVELRVTLKLEGDEAVAWRRYVAAHSVLRPSNGQLVESLMRMGLEAWGAKK